MLKQGTICSKLYVNKSMSTVREDNGEKDTSEATQWVLCGGHEQTVKNFQEINPKEQFKSKLEGAKIGDWNTTPTRGADWTEAEGMRMQREGCWIGLGDDLRVIQIQVDSSRRTSSLTWMTTYCT